jgi:membrane-bound metal-dependent hydrolase YbcI (DUF457 family)
MIAGHFGFAAGVKSSERTVPLWSLMLATAWLDVIFVPLYAGGIETIDPMPGTTDGYGAGIIHADYTHSLLGAAVLSAVYGALFYPRWGRRAGIVLALVAFSHWVLDLIVHHGDMPILPGNAGGLPLLGFGLWSEPLLAAALELILVVGGAALYWRAAREVATPAGLTARADLAAGMILVFGLAVLVLDFTGILG